MNDFQKLGKFIADKFNRLGDMQKFLSAVDNASSGTDTGEETQDVAVMVSVSKRSGDTIYITDMAGLTPTTIDVSDQTSRFVFNWARSLGSPMITVVHDESAYGYIVSEETLSTAIEGEELTATTAKAVYFNFTVGRDYYAVRYFNVDRKQIFYDTFGDSNDSYSDGVISFFYPPRGVFAYIQFEYNSTQTTVGTITHTKRMTADDFKRAYNSCNSKATAFDLDKLEDTDPITNFEILY